MKVGYGGHSDPSYRVGATGGRGGDLPYPVKGLYGDSGDGHEEQVPVMISDGS